MTPSSLAGRAARCVEIGALFADALHHTARACIENDVQEEKLQVG
jgi:hypothetical protein